MLTSAKQVMNAVTRLKLPPKAPTKSPATSGPKLVMTRALPVQNPDRGRADMGREQLRQIDRIAREHAEDEKAEYWQDPRVPGLELGKGQIEDQAEDDRAGA